MEATAPLIEAKLQSMTTAEGVKHWRSELYVDGSMLDASEWTVHPVAAMNAGRELEFHARSDWAQREARLEAHALFA
jgi:hypothetical protein